jgi:hypothetical protein
MEGPGSVQHNGYGSKRYTNLSFLRILNTSSFAIFLRTEVVILNLKMSVKFYRKEERLRIRTGLGSKKNLFWTLLMGNGSAILGIL